MCLADGVMLVMLVMLVMVGKVSSIVPCFFWNKKYVNCETHKMDQNGSFPPQIHISSGSSRLEAAPIFMLVTGLDEPQHSPS